MATALIAATPAYAAAACSVSATVVGGCKTGDYQQHLYVLYHPNNSGDGTEIRRTSSKVRIGC
ncbi:hypothetical protein [Nonomuraea insulae]|uniref:Uncharacterized protein n=1 Tax=Nonomuraea insulae TaxID=1616787 RepID=A0ABW1D717_9ACTN